MQELSKVFIAFTLLVFFTILWLEMPRYRKVSFQFELPRNHSLTMKNITIPTTKIVTSEARRTTRQTEALPITFNALANEQESKLNVLILGNLGSGSTFVANVLTFYPRTYTNDRPLQYFSKKVWL